MTTTAKYLLALTVTGACAASGQTAGNSPGAVATMTASATVVGNIEVVVLKDLEFELTGYRERSFVAVDPQADAEAGKMKIVGNPRSLIRVTYERESILRHENGSSELHFTYNVSGNPTDVQRGSMLLEPNTQVRLSETGVCYIWIGGRLTGLEKVIPGNYTLELILEVEYI